MNIGTRIYTWLNGREVGRDAFGNVYYEDKRGRPRLGSTKARRWVALAADGLDASVVPPEWHAWLHYTVDAPLATPARPWIRPHQANATGTAASYRPAGHDFAGGRRAAATGDYEAWTPGT